MLSCTLCGEPWVWSRRDVVNIREEVVAGHRALSRAPMEGIL